MWFWVLSIAAFTLAIIALVVWQSYQPKEGLLSGSIQDEPSLPIKPVSDEGVSHSVKEGVDKSLPAPAQKLQKLTKENSVDNLNDVELTKRMADLDQQLENLNKQLNEQGVFVPQLSSPDTSDTQVNDASLSETTERLQAIKNHMEEKSVKQ